METIIYQFLHLFLSLQSEEAIYSVCFKKKLCLFELGREKNESRKYTGVSLFTKKFHF